MSDPYRAEPVPGAPRAEEFPPRTQDRGRSPGHRHGYDAYASAAQEAEEEAGAVHDVVSVLGMAADGAGPGVMAVVERLLSEIESLNQAHARDGHQKEFLEAEADRHPVLPGLNRRAFLCRLDAALDEEEAPGALVLIHLEGIETVRLDQGLAAADALSLRAHAALTEGLRPGDLLGCVADGDFAMFLAGSGGAAAAMLAEEACLRIAAGMEGAGEEDPRLRLGIVDLAHGGTGAEALRAADRVLAPVAW